MTGIIVITARSGLRVGAPRVVSLGHGCTRLTADGTIREDHHVVTVSWLEQPTSDGLAGPLRRVLGPGPAAPPPETPPLPNRQALLLWLAVGGNTRYAAARRRRDG